MSDIDEDKEKFNKWAPHYDKYLEAVMDERFYAEETEQLYKKVLKTYPVNHEHLFQEMEYYIEMLEDEEDLSTDDMPFFKEVCAKHNFTILVHNVIQRENLMLCCNNFLREVLGHRNKYTDKDIDFNIELRLFALRSTIDQEGDNELRSKVDTYFPSDTEKYYLPAKAPLNAKKVLQSSLKKREELLEDLDNLEKDFVKEEFNEKLIEFVKHFCGLDEVSPSKRSVSPGSDEEETVSKRARISSEDLEEETASKRSRVPSEDAEEIDELEDEFTDNESSQVPENSTVNNVAINDENDDDDKDISEASIPRSSKSDSDYRNSDDNASDSSVGNPWQSSQAADRAGRSTNSQLQYHTVTDIYPELREDRSAQTLMKVRKTPQPWTPAETEALKQGLERYKGPRWAQIVSNSGGVLCNRTPVQCKDKARTVIKHLEQRGEPLGPWKFVKDYDAVLIKKVGRPPNPRS